MLLYGISLITYPRSVFGFGTQQSSGKLKPKATCTWFRFGLVIHAYHINKDMIWRPDISLFGGDNIELKGGCHITHLCGGQQIKFTRRPPYHFIWWLRCNSIIWGCHIIQLYGSCNIKLCGGQNIVTLGHSFYFFRLTGDFEKKWSRGDEIKIKIKPKNLYSRYTKYKKK